MQQPAAQALMSARNLRKLILENRQATESNRQVAEPVVRGLIESRLGRMALPPELAGLDLPPPDMLDVLATLAEAEASVAWIVWNSALPCYFARFLEPDARRGIFGDPESLYASSTRPMGRAVKDGDSYLVNGRWTLVSGCMHASWIPVMCMVEKGGEVEMLAPKIPHMRMLFVPKQAHEIVDTWHVGGLRGTGSHDTVLRDVVVPAARSFAIGEPSRMGTPRGRVPIMTNMSAGCASICIGIARAALAALQALATAKVVVDGGPGLKDRAPVQALVARADAKIEAARLLLKSTVEALWDEAVAGGDIRPASIAAALAAAITASQDCRGLLTEIYAAAGASALYTDSPIERAHRDIHAVAQHMALQPFWLEQSGRVLLGLDATHPLFRI